MGLRDGGKASRSFRQKRSRNDNRFGAQDNAEIGMGFVYEEDGMKMN